MMCFLPTEASASKFKDLPKKENAQVTTQPRQGECCTFAKLPQWGRKGGPCPPKAMPTQKPGGGLLLLIVATRESASSLRLHRPLFFLTDKVRLKKREWLSQEARGERGDGPGGRVLSSSTLEGPVGAWCPWPPLGGAVMRRGNLGSSIPRRPQKSFRRPVRFGESADPCPREPGSSSQSPAWGFPAVGMEGERGAGASIWTSYFLLWPPVFSLIRKGTGSK